MLVLDKTIETSTTSHVNDPLVELGGFSLEQADALRRTVRLILFQVRTANLPIFARQPDGRILVDVRKVPAAIRKLSPDIQAQAERDARSLSYDLDIQFLSVALMAVFAYDAESVGINLNTFFETIKSPPKVGRFSGMSPVTEYIARWASTLRKTTDLSWPDIAETILAQLKDKQDLTEIEEKVIKRLTDAISTNDRKLIGTVILQTTIALKKHSRRSEA